MQFAGFNDADFDAYLPARGGSNAYNRPRVEVKQKALGLARSLHEAATSAGLPLEVRASEEVPSLWNKRMVTAQWVFFWRDQDARRKLEEVLDKGRTLAATLTDPTPYFRHAFLALYLDAAEVQVALKVHGDAWVDVRNLRARCADERLRDELLAALRALPEDFVVGVTGGATVPARDVDGASLAATFEALTEASQWWFVGRSLPRAEAVARGPELGRWVDEGFRALVPVYRLAAWSQDNDLVSIENEIERRRAERQAHLDEEAAREAAWRAQQDAEIQRRREAAAQETRERVASMTPPRHGAVQSVLPPEVREQRAAPPREAREARSERPAARHEPERKPPTQRPPKPKTEAPPPAEGSLPLAVGAKVKVRNGPFAERVGTVAEVDNRGHARVMFGLIGARLEVTELVTVG